MLVWDLYLFQALLFAFAWQELSPDLVQSLRASRGRFLKWKNKILTQTWRPVLFTFRKTYHTILDTIWFLKHRKSKPSCYFLWYTYLYTLYFTLLTIWFLKRENKIRTHTPPPTTHIPPLLLSRLDCRHLCHLVFINAISVNISGPKMTCLPMSQCGPKGSQIVQNGQFYHLGPVLAYLALRTFSENNFRLKDRECFLAKVLSSKKRTCAKHLPSRTEDHHTALWAIAQPDLNQSFVFRVYTQKKIFVHFNVRLGLFSLVSMKSSREA